MFPPREAKPFNRDWSAPRARQHLLLRQKRELEQVHLCIGTEGFAQQREERYAAALFNTVLGGGMSSRLFQKIREQEGLVYNVLSYHNGHLHGGYEAVYAACNPKNLKRVLDLTLAEMRKIKAEGVTREEMDVRQAAPQGLDPPLARVDRQQNVGDRATGVLLRPAVLPGRDHRAHRGRLPRGHSRAWP